MIRMATTKPKVQRDDAPTGALNVQQRRSRFGRERRQVVRRQRARQLRCPARAEVARVVVGQREADETPLRQPGEVACFHPQAQAVATGARPDGLRLQGALEVRDPRVRQRRARDPRPRALLASTELLAHAARERDVAEEREAAARRRRVVRRRRVRRGRQKDQRREKGGGLHRGSGGGGGLGRPATSGAAHAGCCSLSSRARHISSLSGCPSVTS